MFNSFKIMLAGAVVLASSMFVSVTSAAPTTAPSAGHKCEYVWTKVPVAPKGRVVDYTYVKTMNCDSCKSALDNFFTTGKFAHTCAAESCCASN
ncbi:MAG TPA: hypothetical protein VHD56_19995 [Tepidisphaeraceae bacterium]|nr:hypothetical protein [Tepidisphaeraceae bacterium]